MAQIDFPASPTTGQLFSAANGVTYRYNGTLWLVQAGPGGGTGDFCATKLTGGAGTAALSTLIPNTIVSGNAGNWYSTSTGRYVPPAGRFYIEGFFSGSYASGPVNVVASLRKNGVEITNATDTPNAANQYGQPVVSAIVDANGTDYFELQGMTQGVVGNFGVTTFQAFPLTGMAGPMGPPFGGGTGDFCAVQLTGFPTLPVTLTTLTPNVVVSGNSGGWYSTSTGRFTPPAGRYSISASFTGYLAGAATTLQLAVRKNAAIIQQAYSTVPSNYNAEPSLTLTVDANGTDWFDMQGISTGNTGTLLGITFAAFPLTGMQGPQGAPPTAGTLTAQGIMLGWSGPSSGIGTTPIIMSWDVLTYNSTGGSFTLGGNSFTIPANMGGTWDVNFAIQAGHATASIYGSANLLVNGATRAGGLNIVSQTGSITLNGKFRFVAGDVIQVNVNVGAAGGTVYGGTPTWFHLTRVGA